jgi:tripartite-type tricarboxylate transporter receptor subunit TctC
MKKSLAGAAALAGACLTTAACAQSFPSKPLHVVVPFAPGSVLDIIARLTGEKMGASMGQPVIVDNRAGAGGRLGAESVLRSPADGYTILFTSSGALVGGAFLVKNLTYDTLRDFTPITAAVSPVDALVVTNALPVNNVQELLDYARRNPGKLAYGSNGIGSTFHMVGELIKQVTNIDMLHVPFQGAPEQMNALMTGQIQVGFNSISSARTQAAAGKLKLLAVMRDARYKPLPNVPAFGEAVPAYQALPNWFGYLGPAALPQPVVSRLGAEIVKALNAPDLGAKMDEFGLVPIANTPEQFSALMRTSYEAFGKAVKAAKLEPQ